MSVSYVDMHGRTVATSLAGANPANLASINTNAAFYPVASNMLTNSLLTPVTNLVKGDSIQSVSTLLVPANTTYYFTYQLTPGILQELSTTGQNICFDCKYNLEFSVRKEGCSNSTDSMFVKDYNNLQLVPANQACSTPMGFVGGGITTPTTQISFTATLTPGSWVVRKTLSINDSVFKAREDSALTVFLGNVQQHLSDSVFAALSLSTSCAMPAKTRDCNACQTLLGTSYATSSYKANYITALGGATSLTDSAIHALYTQDSLGCQDVCGSPSNPNFGTLAMIRAQMLADMTPYSGQYAMPTSTILNDSLLQAKYNIFTPNYLGLFGPEGTKPFYLNPVSEPNGAAAYYLNANGNVDSTIYPNGPGVLTNISNDSFANLFNTSWASQLIYYHPEYAKLHFAETTLATTYAWLDKFLQCPTYALASTNGYITPMTSDPYFINNYVPTDATKMNQNLYHYTGTVPSGQTASNNIQVSIWRLANGLALCDSTQPMAIREACMMGMDSIAISPSATTATQQNAVWQAFKGIYLGLRNDMVVSYINAQEVGSLTATAMTELTTGTNEGNKQLRFANSSTTAAQNGWTWWTTATSNTADSVTLNNLANTYTAANTVDACVAQEPFWQSRLQQCEVLQQYLANQDHADSVTVNAIITLIVDSMVMVCHNSIDAYDPSGATNVNPSKLPVTPANFENIVNHVFTQYGIATLPNNYYFCNPYSVDYPKPYGLNPQVNVTAKASADSCNCKQIEMLKSLAKTAGYDTTSLSSMNSFLLMNYNDTLSTALWLGLLQCNGHSWTQFQCTGETNCVTLYNPISLGTVAVFPSFLLCGYVQPCISCNTLQTLTLAFRTLYPAYAGVPYTNGGSATDTGMAKQNALWARYLNYQTGFSRNANDYAAAYLNCGWSTGSTNLVLTNRNAQPPAGSGAPMTYTASGSVVFSNGYSSLPGDNFKSMITATLPASAHAMCALDKPPSYVAMPDTSQKNPCQAVQDQANFIAQILFAHLQDSLTANFDSLYRAKCLGAQSLEVFYASYQPSEYHYTLYYYDQAGNLLKTLPPAAVQPNFTSVYLTQVQTARATYANLSNGTNFENMATQYRYNTLNQVTAQKSPDGGLSDFWYDRLGRLAVSQNAKQVADPSYSYTLYDPLGRITEVGQKPQHTAMTQTISQDTTQLKNWLADLTNGGTKVQMTRTIYDVPDPYIIGAGYITGMNLRNRVSMTMVIDADNSNNPPYRAATLYSYDIHGNVDTLLQDFGPSSTISAVTGNRYKLIKYDYDLISGKVNQVSYQPRQTDEYYHQYTYDAENRLTGVKTSRDSVWWPTEATYTYYRHGPLARLLLGDPKVQGAAQGVDYAYTVQGWLKSINPSSVTASGGLYDADGTGTTATLTARDAYKLNLQYYDDGVYTDYTAIAPPTGYIQGNTLPTAQKRNLYNGNIGSMAVSIRPLAAQAPGAAYAGPLLYNYGYDQLNRITSEDAWAANDSFAPKGTGPMPDYSERYGYDPNGNILKLTRHGTTGTGLALNMDSLSYRYRYVTTGGVSAEYTPGQAPTTGVSYLTNQLSSIGDAVTSTGYNDIKNQSPFNYQYDQIGNLVQDAQSGITSNMTWNVYGKLLTVTSTSAADTFTYDASGNRISKTVVAGGNTITTWYVRDATGNVMAVYVLGDPTKNSGALTQSEIDLYGSSRLGLLTSKLNCSTLGTPPAQNIVVRGSKLFELSNHLGNVLLTISDKKLQQTTDNTNVAYYTPDVISANDYYSFGMLMPGRTYTVATAGSYRYGFNGQEKTDEIAGVGNHTTAEFWEYDPRAGRRWNLDPKPTVGISEYSAFNNNPVFFSDPLGDTTHLIIYGSGYENTSTNQGSAGDGFKRNAEALKKRIEASKGFDKKKDAVELVYAPNAKRFLDATNKAYASGKIASLTVFSHGFASSQSNPDGIGGLSLGGERDGDIRSDGTKVTKEEADVQLRTYNLREINGTNMGRVDNKNFDPKATCTFYGCNLGGVTSGEMGPAYQWQMSWIKKYSFAQNFANKNNLTVHAFSGSAVFKQKNGENYYDGSMIMYIDRKTNDTRLSTYTPYTTPIVIPPPKK